MTQALTRLLGAIEALTGESKAMDLQDSARAILRAIKLEDGAFREEVKAAIERETIDIEDQAKYLIREAVINILERIARRNL